MLHNVVQSYTISTYFEFCKVNAMFRVPGFRARAGDNGSTYRCRDMTRKSMWRAFFRNFGAPIARTTALGIRIMLLNRAVAPVLHHLSLFRSNHVSNMKKTFKDVFLFPHSLLSATFTIPWVYDLQRADL